MSAGIDGHVTGDSFMRGRPAWGAGATLTLVHFVRDNFAIGGTLSGSLARRGSVFGYDEPITSYSGGDIDLIGHVPLSRRLSLRFWSYIGVRHQTLRVEGESHSEPGAESHLYALLGFSPEFVMHLSSSMALGIGPRLVVYAPISAHSAWDVGAYAGPRLSYSFGAAPDSESAASAVRPRFAGKGRRVLTGGASLGTTAVISMGYARFVTEHFALGPYVFGSAIDDAGGTTFWLGGGVRTLVELPLSDRWSMLFGPEASYRFKRTALPRDAGDASSVAHLNSHELQFTLSVLPVYNLFEAVVVGVGPTLSEHLLLGTSEANGLSGSYQSIGVTSMLAGSF